MDTILLLSIITISAYTDGKDNKIRNKYIAPAIILGLIISFYIGGVDGIKSSLLGIFIPFISLLPLFIIRVIGAGDIKLFSTIGAIMGFKFVINNFMYSIIIAAIMATIILIGGRNMINRLKNLIYYIVLCIYSRKMLEYPNNQEKNSKLPLAIAIFIGTLIQLISGYNFFY